MNWIADTIDSHRRLICGLIVILTAIALVGVSRLDYEMKPGTDIRSDGDDFRLLVKLYQEFNYDASSCVILLKAKDVFEPEIITVLRQLTSEIRNVNNVIQVYSIDDVLTISNSIPRKLLPGNLSDRTKLQQARHTALAHPLVVGQLLSPDGGTTVIIVRLKYLPTIAKLTPPVENIRDITRRIAEKYNLKILVTGAPALVVDTYTTLKIERIKFTALSSFITLTIAVLLLRNFSAIAITSIPHLFGVLWTLGAMGWMGIKWTMLGTAIPSLLIAIGFTDAVHLMLHMRHEVAAGSTAKAGAILAIRRIGIACALTSLTTGVGFGSLLLASCPAVRDFGGCCALGCVLTFIAVITLVPLLSGTFLGRRCVAVSKSKPTNRWNYFFDWIARYVLAKPKLVTACGILITLGLLTTALRLRPDTYVKFLPPEHESIKAFEIFEQDFKGGGLISVLLDWHDSNDTLPPQLADALKDVHAVFDDDPFTTYPISALNLLQSIGPLSQQDSSNLALLSIFPAELVNRFIRFDNRRALVNARCRDQGASVSMAAFSRLEQALAKLSTEYKQIDFHLAGEPLLIWRSLYMIITDLARSLAFAALIIFGIITLEFRSFRYGLICLIPNIFPLAVISAYLVCTNQPLHSVSVLVFTICLGIAVDDTIHFMTRFRTEFRQCGNAYQAVKRSFTAVGKALVITTIVFLSGFGSCAPSSLPIMRDFATLACIGFAAALAGDLLILPALLLVCFHDKDPSS